MADRRVAWRRMVVALLLAAAALLTSCGGRGQPSAPPSTLGTPIDLPIPAPLLDMALIDSSGRQITLSSFRGRIVVLSDLLTLCQETCPVSTAALVQAAKAVAASGRAAEVEFVSITVDPQRDTPARLAAYRALYEPAPANWVTLTGSPADINRLWNTLGVWRQRVADEAPAPTDWLTRQPLTYDVEHSDQVLFLDARMHDRFVLDGPAHVRAATDIPRSLSVFLNDKGRHNVADPSAEAWTPEQALQVVSWLVKHPIHAG